MGLGKSGAQNAALLAVQILALSDESLREAFRAHKAGLADKVEQADARVKKWREERR